MKIIFFPFIMLFKFIEFLLKIVGTMLGFIIGLSLLILGIVLTVTIVASFIGVPLAALGLIIMIKAL